MPSGRLERSKVCGLVQAAQSEMTLPPDSSRHSNVAPASPVNDHDGDDPLPVAGGSLVKSGALGAAESSS